MSLTEAPAEGSVENLLRAVKQLSPPDLDLSARQFREWQTTEGRSDDDASLVARIEANSRLPGAQQQRFEALRRKRQAGRLASPETRELQALWERAEEMNVVRLEALVHLARLRGVNLESVMRDLHLDQHPYAS